MKRGKRTIERFPREDSGAGEESRTLDLNLGKVALYQLSYSRIGANRIIRKARFRGNYLFHASGTESFRYHTIDTRVSTAAT
jgi:hypothetical protein